MARTEQAPKGPPSAASAPADRLLECYKRGIHLATCEKDYDYAHALFAECVLHDPSNVKFVEAMVQNLRARTPKDKKSLFKFHRGRSGSFKKAVQSKQWKDVFRTGIELLKTDPWDVTTLQAMAEACATLHHNEAELVYLKQALDAQPKNVAVNRHCAKSLGRMGQFDQAIACWHRVEMLKGKDEEATKMISMLAEEKLKYPGGRPPGMQSRQAPVEEPQSKETPRDVPLTPKQKLEQAIARDPHDVTNYLELAELLLSTNQFDAAESLLIRAVAACGEQQGLLNQLQQVRYLRSEEDRALAEKRASTKQKRDAPHRKPWLELALVSALVGLVLQVVPSAGAAARTLFNVAQWSRSGWFLFNAIVLLGLFAVRFGPDFRGLMERRRVRPKIGARGETGKSAKT